MSVFCLLWIPAFYFFRRSVCVVKTVTVWRALLLGCAAVFVRYLAGPPFAPPPGFGVSCWLYGFFNFVCLPVLVPVVVRVILSVARLLPRDLDTGGFTLLWLVPSAFYYSAGGYLFYSPLMLVLVPLLWTAQALGVSFFIDRIIAYRRRFVVVPLALSALILPPLACTSWWAFYSQRTPEGFLFLFLCAAPAAVSMITGREGRNGIV